MHGPIVGAELQDQRVVEPEMLADTAQPAGDTLVDLRPAEIHEPRREVGHECFEVEPLPDDRPGAPAPAVLEQEGADEHSLSTDQSDDGDDVPAVRLPQRCGQEQDLLP